MFAIIKTGGKQYRVSVGDILEIERLPLEAGSRFDFKEVLLIDDGTRTWLGQPYLPRAVVRAELLEEFKDEKIIVFKKKRRKQYKRKRGHRQIQSRVKILEIVPDLELKEKELAEPEKAEEAKVMESSEVREAEVPSAETSGSPEIIEKEVGAEKKPKATRKKKESEKAKTTQD
jgi:large subunit ribosomal protein L21